MPYTQEVCRHTASVLVMVIELWEERPTLIFAARPDGGVNLRDSRR